MNSIQKLSDSELILKLKTSVSDERKQTALVLEFLKEVDLVSGKLNLSFLAQAQKFFKTEEKYSGEKQSVVEKLEVLEKLEGKSSRECELELRRMSSAPLEISNPEKERVIDEEFTEWKLLVDSELREMLDRIQALRSHAQPSMGKAELLKRLDPVEKEKQKLKKTETTTFASEVTVSQFKRVQIAAKKRRLIWNRAQGVCEYRDSKTGKACGSRYFLEIDHIKPVAMGGGNEESNLRLLCRTHNARSAIKVFGYMKKD